MSTPRTLLLRDAAVVAAMDATRREIAGGGVFIRGHVIEAVGTAAELPATADEIIACRDMVLLPGLINTHHHFFQTLTRAVPAAQDAGLGILCWSPLGRGVLTGKYRSGTPSDSRSADPDLEAFVGAYLNDRAHGIVEAVCKAADGLGLSPVQVALAWVSDRPGVTSAIVGARTAAQLLASLASEDVELPTEIVVALDDISAPSIGYPER